MHGVLKSLVFASLALSMTARAELSLTDAQRRALERSRQLAGQQATVTASREMAVSAGERPDPVLKLGIDNLPVNGPDRFSTTQDFMTMRRIGVMQELTRGEKREWRARRFEREAERSEAERDASVAAIQRDTALAWLERYYAELMLGIVEEQVAQARLEVQAAEAAYRGARASQAEVFGAHTTLATLEDRSSESARRVAVAKANLERWVGEAAEDALAQPPAMDAIPLEVGKLETHLAGHPEIVALAKQEEVAAAEAGIARANRRPDWTVELAYQQRGPAFSNMISVGLAVPLPWDRANRQDRDVAAKLAMVESARAQRDEMLRAHIAEVRAMLIEWQNGRERGARYNRELIPLARERARAALAAYQGGRAPVADLLAARRNEADVRMQGAQLGLETARLWARLNFLLPDHTLHEGHLK